VPYPIEELTPETPDAEKEAAVQATLQQMMAEGMPQEEAQSTIMTMMQDLMATGSEQWPSESPTNYGSSMRNPSSIFARGKSGDAVRPGTGSWRNGMNDRYTNFNPGFLSDGRVSDR